MPLNKETKTKYGLSLISLSCSAGIILWLYILGKLFVNHFVKHDMFSFVKWGGFVRFSRVKILHKNLVIINF